MRNLIRPTVFLLLRLALFIAVIFWGVGQYWTIITSSPYGSASLYRYGYAVGYADQLTWGLNPIHLSDTSPEFWELTDLAFGELPENKAQELMNGEMSDWTIDHYPGFGFVSHAPSNTRMLFFKHWFTVVVVIFAYVATKAVYRKRKPSDD